MPAPSDRARSAFPPVARLVAGEAPMYRIETVVLIGLYMLLLPAILVLTLH